MVTMALFADEIRKSAGNAGIKTFTSKLDQGLMADAVTRGELPGMLSLFLSIYLFFRQRRAYVRKSILTSRYMFSTLSREFSSYCIRWFCVAEHIPKPSNTGIPAGMGVDFLPVSKQDSKEGMCS